jgi:arylsulfatase A-like enzyme
MPPSTDADPPENLLFVFTDQHRQDAIGAYGNDVVETPNLDRLAAEGLRFDRAYTPSAICSPARASVVSGVKPVTHGIHGNVSGSPTLMDDFPCYPRLLRDAGYNVGLAGKWHLGAHPREFGFDGEHYPGYMPPMENDDYEAYLDERGLARWTGAVVGERFPAHTDEYMIGCVDERPVEASFTHFVAERAIERIEAYATETPERPFCLSSHFFGPHRPYLLPEEYFEMYDPGDVRLPESAVKETFDGKPDIARERYGKTDLRELTLREWRRTIALYYGYVSLVDDQIGRILDTLDEHGLGETTTVAFSADHGSFVTAHKNLDKGPLMYEDVYNVPMIVSGLGRSGETTDALVSLLDLAPTFLDAAGVAIPDVYDGRSLFELDGGADGDGEDWRESLTAEFHGLNTPYEQRMIVTDRYKLVRNADDTDELYDLREDPHELHNRIGDGDYASVHDELHRELAAVLADDGDDFPGEDWLYPARSPFYYPTEE